MKKDLLCVGMALVDSIIKGFNPEPVTASGYLASSGSLNAGGEAVNEAVAGAKLGLSTGILCTLGMDAADDLVTGVLSKSGVDTACIQHDPAHPTPVTTMFVREDGSRKSITNGSHRYNFHPEQFTGVLQNARAVSLGSLFRAPFDDPEIIRSVVRTVHESGGMVFADTKLPNFRKLTLEDIKEALPFMDYIFPNEDEARYYSGKDEPEAMADAFLDAGVPNVIVKLGGKGCLFKNRHETVRLSALPIDPVDATGAGDNFLAGFVAAKLWGIGTEPGALPGADTRDALRFANACGALCTTAVGAHAGLRNRGQVLEMMKKQPEA